MTPPPAPRAPRVLVVGDANLDLVLRGDVVPRFGQAEQLIDAADVVLGSSAGICAAGLARLGVPTELCARVGDDLFGRETLRLLGERGVGVSEVAAVDAPTGLSVILSAPDDRAILTLGGAMVTLTADDVLPAVERTGATHVHVASFFLLPELAPGLPGVLAELRARGITTSLDTNWDPAERWDGVAECLPLVDVLLPNANEAVALARAVGADAASALDAATALAGRGPIVVVKDGAAGGFAVSAAGVVRSAPPAVDVVDTTGAGDSFDAGFLSGWTAGLPLDECLRRAAAAGALSTRAAGGTGAQATASELAEALA
jgi:ribokinase